MTLLTENSDISYAGLTGQDTFAYDFRVDLITDMGVTLDGVAVAQGDFTMTGLGNPAGGDVVLNTPLVANARVVLFRTVPPTQEVDYQPFDAFPSETHEGALDKLTMLVQQVERDTNLGLRFPAGDPASTILPDVAGRADLYLGFDSSGEPIALAGIGGDVTATLPIRSSGGINPNITIDQATSSNDGSLIAADKALIDSALSGRPLLTTVGPGFGGVGQEITLAGGANFVLPKGNHLIDILATSVMRIEYATNSNGTIDFSFPLTLDPAEKKIRVYSDGVHVRVKNIGGVSETVNWWSFS